ncbi:MAG: uroporphyrinogen decarboxylase [Crocinitomicaceae bacterium]|nr:uroporphyrinogen decarboxylase [Crocinitomicaceae bacterium]
MPTAVDFIGYAASFFVLLSFLMKKMTLLRTVNIIGCGFFIWYGILLDSWPIIITNMAIVFVNFFYLLRAKN